MDQLMQLMRGFWKMVAFDRALPSPPGCHRMACPKVSPPRMHGARAPQAKYRSLSIGSPLSRMDRATNAMLSVTVRNDERPPSFQTIGQHPTVQICYYESLMQLRAAAELLESDANRLSVVLVLDSNFSGHLPTLIRRRHPALQLIITAPNGRLPGFVTVGDLDAASGALGWRQIVFEREVEPALKNTIATLDEHDRLVVFWPAWRERAPLDGLTNPAG